jgi:hypothetical protein
MGRFIPSCVALVLLAGITPIKNGEISELRPQKSAIPIEVNLDATAWRLDSRSARPPLWDGNLSYNDIFFQACEEWNKHLNGIQLRPYGGNNPTGGQKANGKNKVFFADTFYGEPFEALARCYITGPIEGDILINSNYAWNSYEKGLEFRKLDSERWDWVYNLRNTFIHEIGHILGLPHPDENGEPVSSIMNATGDERFILDAPTEYDVWKVREINRISPPPTRA